jgi:lysine 2,3-aminomutase
MVGPGKSDALDGTALDAAFAYIGAHPEIWEVILTGGDPFILTPRRIAEVTQRLARFAHVKVLRWHTRVPVAAPDLVTSELVRALKQTPQSVYVVLHANHPRELGADARAACARIIDSGVPMLSQSVLLRGVNDRVEVLQALMRTLVETRVKPYYLHHADLAPGTRHFRTDIGEGQSLLRALHAGTSGLCQPDYVLDIPGGHAKARLREVDLDTTQDPPRLRDAEDAWHDYPAGRASAEPQP